MITKVNYPKEVLMKNQPIGTVFACGQELWVKVSGQEMMQLGTGDIEKITQSCMAKVVKTLEGYL